MAALTLRRTLQEVPLSLTSVSYFRPGPCPCINCNTYVGPKMYSALTDRKGIGSTKLHLDVAPAFNVLAYADSQGCANWKIFARKDADLLAAWMRKRYKIKGHPVHQQQFYLTDDDLVDLRKETQIHPYNINQRQNHIVLIPPGCPHQVQ
jgi:lysine-specific demethylase 3